MKFIYLIFLLSAQNTFAKNYVLKVGDHVNIPINQSSNVSISDSKVISWIDKGSILSVKAQKVGTTQLKIKQILHTITILNDHDFIFYKNTQNWLTNVMGLKIKIDKGQLVINGQLHRVKDWVHLTELSKKSNGRYLFNAYIDHDLQSELKNYFNKIFNSFKHLSPQLSLIPKVIVYRKNTINSTSFDNLLANHGISPKDLKKVNTQIRLNLHFIDINKSLQKKYGLHWDGGLQAQLIPEKVNLSKLLFSLNNESGSGQYKLISSTQLICLINESCEINEGGEIPIKTKNFSYSTVKWKPYGLSIKFTPTLTYNNRVNYQLDYHLSHPDFTQVADGTPSFKVKKISTAFSATFNKPIYIGGLTIDSKSKSQSGRIPFNLTPLLQKILSTNVTSNSESNLFLIINSQLIEEKQYD